MNAKHKALESVKGERSIDIANRNAKKPSGIGYGSSLKHKKAWAKLYKSAGSKTDSKYLDKSEHEYR